MQVHELAGLARPIAEHDPRGARVVGDRVDLPERLGVAGVEHLDRGVHGVDRGEHGGDVRAGGIARPITNASSGSARGWISSATVIGWPGGRSMSAVIRPYTGSRMPSASRLTLLVMPSLTPTTRFAIRRSPDQQSCAA